MSFIYNLEIDSLFSINVDFSSFNFQLEGKLGKTGNPVQTSGGAALPFEVKETVALKVQQDEGKNAVMNILDLMIKVIKDNSSGGGLNMALTEIKKRISSSNKVNDAVSEMMSDETFKCLKKIYDQHSEDCNVYKDTLIFNEKLDTLEDVCSSKNFNGKDFLKHNQIQDLEMMNSTLRVQVNEQDSVISSLREQLKDLEHKLKYLQQIKSDLTNMQVRDVGYKKLCSEFSKYRHTVHCSNTNFEYLGCLL